MAFEPGAAASWVLGPLTLWVGRRPGQVWVASRSTGDPADDHLKHEPQAATSPPDGVPLTRFAVGAADWLTLRPRHADRPVVARPEVPLVVGPGQTIQAYSSAPVWLAIDVGEVITETPVLRPSDTWFGTTTEGRLCYAVRTHLRTDLDGVLIRAHRAITPIELRNEGADPLRIERILLPATHLPIYADSKGYLWSGAVCMTRTEGQENARVDVVEGPPAERPDAVLLSDPREPTSTLNPVLRVFNSVFV